MDPREAEKIAAVLNGLETDVADAVLAEFEPQAQRVILDKAQRRNNSHMAPESLLTMMESAVGSRWSSTETITQSDADCGPAVARHSAAKADWFACVEDERMLSLPHDEHPQTIAFCLSALCPERAAALLSSMQGSERVDVLQRLRDLAPVAAQELLADIEAALLAEPEGCANAESAGVAKAKAILDRIPSQIRQELWETLASPDDVTTKSLDGVASEDLRAEFTKALEGDASLASLEFTRLLREQWPLLDPLIESFSVETLYKAAQGLDLGARQTFYGRLPDAIQLQMDVFKSKNLPVVISEIHKAQASILKRALASDGYRLAVWHSKRHISVSA